MKKMLFFPGLVLFLSLSSSLQLLPEAQAGGRPGSEPLKRGVLVLAHGVTSHHGGGGGHGGGHGHHPPQDPWEMTVQRQVSEAARLIDAPVELAFGMWNRENFQRGVDTLAAKGVTHLRVVPFFVSDHSLVIRAQRYQFRLSEENPLAHWGFDPGRLEIPSTIQEVTFSPALGDSEELSSILLDRARELSAVPQNEELFLIAHGPVSDEDDLLWLKDLNVHAARIEEAMHLLTWNKGFARIHVQTLRDDAPAEVRDEMTRKLRERVQEASARGKAALIVPVLLAPGGIEKGLLKRLEGLEYRYKGTMIAPDPRLSNWIVRGAAGN